MMLVEKTPGSWLVVSLALILLLVGVWTSFWRQEQDVFVLYFIAALMVPLAVMRRGSHEASKDTEYMAVIFCLGLFLLLSATMVTENLQGWDIHQEYAIFQEVLTSGFWTPSINIPYNSLLSISILPTILNEVSAIDGISIFKFIFPLLFSLVPLLLYKLCRETLSPTAAFLSVFLFISYPAFNTELIALARQEIAEFLLVLTLWLFLSKRSMKGRSAILVLLTVGMVAAHYSIAYLYVFILAVSSLLPILQRRKRLASSYLLLITVVITIIWYAYITSGGDFNNAIYFMQNIYHSFQEFLNPSSRPPLLLGAIGLEVSTSLFHIIYRITYYAVYVVLIVGFFKLATKKDRTEQEAGMLSIVTAGFILQSLLVFLPNFAIGLNFSRTYHISLLLMSPCFGYGIPWLCDLPSRLRATLGNEKSLRVNLSHYRGWFLAAILLMSFFLTSSGWVWAATGDIPTSYVFDYGRMLTYPDATSALKIGYFGYFTVSEDASAASWLKIYRSDERPTCADEISAYHVLASYGGEPLSGFTHGYSVCDISQSVFFNTLNSRYGIWPAYSATGLTGINETNIKSEVLIRNRIYSNSGTTIYS